MSQLRRHLLNHLVPAPTLEFIVTETLPGKGYRLVNLAPHRPGSARRLWQGHRHGRHDKLESNTHRPF